MADRNQCAFVCYHDPQCDFVNFANGNCYFGDLNATSPLPGAPPMTTTGWIKRTQIIKDVVNNLNVFLS